jgi:hypothetical protein
MYEKDKEMITKRRDNVRSNKIIYESRDDINKESTTRKLEYLSLEEKENGR